MLVVVLFVIVGVDVEKLLLAELASVWRIEYNQQSWLLILRPVINREENVALLLLLFYYGRAGSHGLSWVQTFCWAKQQITTHIPRP